MDHTNDGDIVLGGFELPERNVDGDTTLTLGLELVEHPCVLEGTLAEFGSFLQRTLAWSMAVKGDESPRQKDCDRWGRV